MEYFVTEIQIKQLRHLSNICIELNHNKRTNLLLTGKNGSGKTTVLRAMKDYLAAINQGVFADFEATGMDDNHYGLRVVFNKNVGIDEAYARGRFLTAFYSADRKTSIVKHKNIEDVVLKTSYPLESNPENIWFI